MAKPYASTESINDWDFRQRHVQDNLENGRFISAKSVLIASGPPKLSTIGSTNNPEAQNTYPIGVVDNLSIGQQKGLQRIFEIGSDKSYFLPGRTLQNLNFGRVMFHGPSLMRALYSYYPQNRMSNFANPITNRTTSSSGDTGNFATPDIRVSPGSKGQFDPTGNGNDNETNADFFINLASDLFDKPLGLLIVLESSEGKPYGSMYLEEVYLQSHQFNVNANSIIVAEAVSAQFESIVPIPVDNLNISKDKTPNPSS